MKTCETCKFLYADSRHSEYSRPPMYFCKKKGALHSRNFRIGEGTRIDKNSEACIKYKKSKLFSKNA